MTADKTNPEYVTVVCKTCAARVYERVHDEAYQVKCADCFEQVTIPPRDVVQQRMAEKESLKIKPDDVGSYGLGAVEERYQPETGIPEDEPEPHYIKTHCGTCHAQMEPEVKQEAYHISCPDCNGDIRVPAEWEVPKKVKKKKKKPRIESFDASEEPTGEFDYFEKREAIRQEIPDPPPNWAFFSRVFEFPWMAGTLSRWVYMTLLLECAGVLGQFAWSYARDASGDASGPGFLVVAFFVLPEIWFAIWSFSYISACFLPVVIDTAAGNDTIRTWPEPNWREWMTQAMYIGYVESVAIAASYGLGLAVESIGGSYWLTFGIANYFLFPLMLLSSLEAGTVFMPLTLPILKSMGENWWCWVLYYIETALIWALWIGGFLITYRSAPYVAVVLGIPLLTAVFLITARLLGRLAWRAGLTEMTAEEILEQEESEEEF